MHIFHSCENIKTCIFTAVKIQDLIFSRERNPKVGTTFLLFSQYGLRGATLLGISVSFLRETTLLFLWKCKQKVRIAYKLNKRKSFL